MCSAQSRSSKGSWDRAWMKVRAAASPARSRLCGLRRGGPESGEYDRPRPFSECSCAPRRAPCLLAWWWTVARARHRSSLFPWLHSTPHTSEIGDCTSRRRCLLLLSGGVAAGRMARTRVYWRGRQLSDCSEEWGVGAGPCAHGITSCAVRSRPCRADRRTYNTIARRAWDARRVRRQPTPWAAHLPYAGEQMVKCSAGVDL